LRAKLARRSAEEAEVEKVVARLRDNGYVDDDLVAESHSEFRRDYAMVGQKRVLDELRRRGVDPSTAERAVEVAYAEADEAGLARNFLRRKLGQDLKGAKIEGPRELNRLYGALARAGFDARRPALFSWFGVTFYLGREAIRRTLQTIAARMAPGSSVMFDYLADPARTPAAWRGLQERCAGYAARRGEPWISSFDPAEMPAFLAELGYSDIANLEPDQIGPQYFSRHPDLVYPPFVGFCHAATSEG
jgi:SOS response regulatory protein OraA/RecX